jgi:DNA-binding LacI/PurR family transcriptional regulator
LEVPVATIKDVAKLAGVSFSTVSIVLSGHAEKRKISTETQRKVLQAANDLQYTPNVAARKLKASGAARYSVAVYWPADYRTYFISKTINGLESARKSIEEDIDLLIYPYDNDRLDAYMSLSNVAIHGAIVVAPSELDMQYLEKSAFRYPVVILNRKSEKHPTVAVDNYDLGRVAAEHLLNAGFSVISAVFAESPYPAMSLHRQGFLDTCNSRKCIVTIFNIANSSMEEGYHSAKELIDYGLPGVIFYDSDAVARGALCAFHKSGIAIPRDVSVFSLSAGLAEVCAYAVPPLSVLEIPHDALASEGLLLLYEIIRCKSGEARHVLLKPNLMIRDSCV